MTARFATILAFLLITGTAFAQKGKVKGVIKDHTTGETVIGATVTWGDGLGTVTDIDGQFLIELDYGSHELTVSFVGFQPVTKTVVVDKKNVEFKASLKPVTLGEVEVVADIARERETPVAFANILPATVEEELASQDLPMVLNTTPGVYATQQGGGDGDARITIRGFSQRNVAVMIDGIPVNDMENGWVYWSNWFGLDAVTRSIQVQRGLGASKIAIPSVGGTMNILTKGIDAKKGVTMKQEYGTGNFTRTSLGITSGKLKNGFGFTAAGSFKKGNGWVDEAWTQGWFYYLKAEKQINKHILSLSAMGAPQSHAQRSFKQPISAYSTSFAEEQGINLSQYGLDGDDINANYGRTYNSHWGTYETYTVNGPGDTTRGDIYTLSERVNYYHKPQFALRDFWSVNDKMYISNIAYLSIGNGGGTGAKNSISANDYEDNGQINWQQFYNANVGNTPIDFSIDPNWSDTERKSSQILRSSINNHFWYGLLSTFTYRKNDTVTFSGGIDLRSYRGEHTREVYDLIGGDYYIAPADEYSENDTIHMLRVGDRFGYNNDGLVRWGGAFGQWEYVTPAFSSFANVSFAYSGYKRIDYFKERDIVIGDDVYREAVDRGGTFFHDPTTGQGLSAYNGANVTTSGDTVFVDNLDSDAEDGFIVNPNTYDINSAEARDAQTEWKWIPGFTIKTGANYNLNEYQNVFANVGFISKAQRFNNVINNDNQFFENAKNERIMAFELGYAQRREKWAANLNAYITQWQNKPGTAVYVDPQDPDERIPVNLTGMNARHMGVEIDAVYKASRRLNIEGLASVGDWRWISQGEFEVNDPNTGNPLDTVFFNAEGIKVGDAAQSQYAAAFRYEFIQNKESGTKAYFKARYTVFDRHFSDFDPIDYQLDDVRFVDNFDANGNPRQSWQIPGYALLDIHTGVNFKFNNTYMSVRASILNVLDRVYISDATNNDKFNALDAGGNFNAASAAVFIGQGRRFNTSVTFKF